MNPLAQRIAYFQHTNDPVGETLDHRDFQPQPQILYLRAERLALVEQRLGASRKFLQALQQWRRRAITAELFDRGARPRQRVARQITPIEIAVVLAAILQMVVDLQAGAQRIGGSPSPRAFAMDV